ncbi:hypothetical protein ACHQM5_003187 [Ranunculus cassubicifolius]
MEKTLKEKAKQGELEKHKIALPSYNKPSVSSVKLAGIAISLRLRLRAADMPVNMQEHALSFTRSLLDSATKANPSQLARPLKKEFDSLYGPAWHCICNCCDFYVTRATS